MKDFEKRFRFFNIAVAGLVVFMIFHLLTIQTNANVLMLTAILLKSAICASKGI